MNKVLIKSLVGMWESVKVTHDANPFVNQFGKKGSEGSQRVQKLI